MKNKAPQTVIDFPVEKFKSTIVRPINETLYGDMALSLHLRVRANLGEGEKHHLLEKNINQLFPKDGETIGCFVQDELCGLAVIREAASLDGAIENKFITCGEARGVLDQTYDSGKVWVLQSVCVDPGILRHGIFGKLLKNVHDCAGMYGIGHVFAQTSISNYCSLRGFIHNDFAAVSTWLNEKDGRQRVLVQRPVVKSFEKITTGKKIVFPPKGPDFSEEIIASQISEAINLGFIGTGIKVSGKGMELNLAKVQDCLRSCKRRLYLVGRSGLR
ncbi:MAG: hypothetical protein PHX43_08930 [Alphaproteobacteria bacterium]|nr:hypothetical protein [Alphaproteobacteria bacterium]